MTCRNRECLTSVVPTTDLIREEMSDLTEADLEDIEKMIIEERVRIQTKPGQPQPPRMSPNGPLPGQPGHSGQLGAHTVTGQLKPTTATLSTPTSQLVFPAPQAPQVPQAPQTPQTPQVTLAPQVTVAPQAPSSHPAPNVSYVSTARFGPPPVMATSIHDAAQGPSFGAQAPVPMVGPQPMTGVQIEIPPRIEEYTVPLIAPRAPMPTTQPEGSGASAPTPAQEAQEAKEQYRNIMRQVKPFFMDNI